MELVQTPVGDTLREDQINGKEDNSWGIKKIKKDDTIEVKWNKVWYDCFILDLDIPKDRVKVRWVGGNEEEDKWMNFSST